MSAKLRTKGHRDALDSHKTSPPNPVDANEGVSGLNDAESVTQDDIRLLAYLKWEADGKPIGHDLFFWLEAERELLARH
jgi:hypothetical protein